MALNRGWSWKASIRSIHPCTSSSLWPRWARRPLTRSMDLNGQEDYLGLKITPHIRRLLCMQEEFSLVSPPPACFVFFCNVSCRRPGLWLPAATPFWRVLWLPWLLGECQLPWHPPCRVVWEHRTQTAHSQRSEVTTLCTSWKTKDQTDFKQSEIRRPLLIFILSHNNSSLLKKYEEIDVCLHSCQELNEKIETTLMSIW